MSEFLQRPELGTRLFDLVTINPVPAAPTAIAAFGAVGKVSSIFIQAPRTNTLPIEFGSPGFVAGNGILVYPGDAYLIKIDDAAAVAIVDPAASGLQTLRVLEID